MSNLEGILGSAARLIFQLSKIESFWPIKELKSRLKSHF